MERKNKTILTVLLGIMIALFMAGIVLIFLFLQRSRDTSRYEELLSLGDKYLEEMDYENAILTYTQAININKKSEDGYLQLSNVYMEYGDYEGALIVLNDCVERVGEGDVSEEIIQRRQDVEAMAANVSTEPEEAEVEATPEPTPEANASEVFYTYIRDVLVPQRGMADLSTVQGTVALGQANNWLAPGGIVAGSVYDFDKDGQEELLVLYYDTYVGNYVMDGGECYALYAEMYEAVGGEVQQTYSDLLAPPAIEGQRTVVSCDTNQVPELRTHINIQETAEAVHIMVEYHSIMNLFADGSSQNYWTMRYNNEVLYTDYFLKQTEGGSTDFEYTGYVLDQNGQILSEELEFRMYPVEDGRYGTIKETVIGFFTEHQFAVSQSIETFPSGKPGAFTDQAGAIPIYTEYVDVFARNPISEVPGGTMQRTMTDYTELRSHVG